MIFIAGASGFTGSHLIELLLAKGFSLKCLSRSEKASAALSSKGIAVIKGDITDPSSLRNTLQPDDFVIHLVGIIEEKGATTFRSVHVDGTAHLVEEARRAGVRHFFYQSALGADLKSWSAYLKTKAEAEELVKSSGISHTIFRPSLIIGPWDGFTRKILDMLKLSPVLPIPGDGTARFQPVYVKDWLTCMLRVIEQPDKYSSTYEIGGPEHLTYRSIVEQIARTAGFSRPSFTIPMGIMKLAASVFESVLPSPPVTSSQLRLLEQDNICDINAIEKHFGFLPRKFSEALQDFMPPTA